MIRVDGLTVRAGAFALGPLAFDVDAGEYLAVIGPSGAGKSVLLETVAGLRPAAAGRIEAGGRDVTALPPERRGVGFVGQEAMLFPHLSVAANIAFGLEVTDGMGLRGAWRARRRSQVPVPAREIVDALGVADLLTRRPGSLSGGERQRVALARALAVRPRALLLDEPLSALDQDAREELQAVLRRVHERFAMTVVHVTHSLDEAMAVAPRCAVMDGGALAQVGAIDDVVARPASAVVARLTGARNVLPGVAALSPGGSIVTLRQGLRLRSSTEADGPVTAVVRADAIVVTRDEGDEREGDEMRGATTEPTSSARPPGASDENQVLARIVGARETPAGRLVEVDTEGLVALVPRAYGDGLNLAPGRPVRLVIPEESVHLISEHGVPPS